MTCIKVSAKALLLSSIAIAAIGSNGIALAAVQSSAGGPNPSTIVIRGSSETTRPASSENDPTPVVLRGSRPSAISPPVVTYRCPVGYIGDPSNGCVVPEDGYAPYDYDYWPYWAYDEYYPGGPRHRFRHGFAARAGRGAVGRFAHPAINGFGRGLARVGGFRRR